MITQTPWMERKFNFDFPTGYFPCILERLTGTPARAEEMIRNASEDKLIEKRNGKWSVKEHIGHLAVLEELHEMRVDDFLQKREMLTAWDTTNSKTETAQHNLKSASQLLENLRSVRSHLVRRIKDLPQEVISQTAMHPRLKVPMRLVDMALFLAEHDDHHLARIRAILSS